MLRTRRFFTTPELVRFYKAQILSFIESSPAAIYHAAPSTLAWIDRVQHRFLRETSMSELDALRDFRLAPLKCRRDMAMLDVLHKIDLGGAPSQLQALFPKLGLAQELPGRRRLRFFATAPQQTVRHAGGLGFQRSLEEIAVWLCSLLQPATAKACGRDHGEGLASRPTAGPSPLR